VLDSVSSRGTRAECLHYCQKMAERRVPGQRVWLSSSLPSSCGRSVAWPTFAHPIMNELKTTQRAASSASPRHSHQEAT